MTTPSSGAASRARVPAASPSNDPSLSAVLAGLPGVTDADALPAAHVLDACDRLALVASHRGDVLWLNAAASARLGIDPQTLSAGVSLRALVTDLEAAEEAFARSLRAPVEDVPLTLRAPDGTQTTLLWSLAPLGRSGHRPVALAMIGAEPSRLRTVRLLRALHALAERDDLVVTPGEPTLLYSRIAEQALAATDAAVAWIAVREDASDVLVTVDAIVPGEPRRHAVRTPRAENGARAPLVGEPVPPDTFGFDPRLPDPLRLWATEKALTHLVAVPLRTGLGHIGTLGIAVRADAALGGDEEGRLRQFADAAAAVIDRARLVREDAEQARRSAAFTDAMATIRRAPSAADAEQAALIAIGAITGFPRVMLFAAPGPEDDFRLSACIAPAPHAPAAGLALARADIPSLLDRAATAMVPDAAASTLLPGPIVHLLRLRSVLIAPISGADGIRMVVLADDPVQPRLVPPRTMGLVSELLHQAATTRDLLEAAERASALARTLEARTTELETLQRVNTATHGTLELEQVLRHAVEEGCRLAGVRRCAIMLTEDAESAVLRAVSREGAAPQDAIGRSFPLAAFTRTRLALHTQRIVEITDSRIDPLAEDERAWMQGASIRSSLIVPIVGHTRALGTIAFSSVHEVKTFSEREKELCHMLAQNLASAIENARMYEAERRQHHYAETVSRISRTVSTTLSVSRVLRVVGEAVVQILGADRCGIFLLEDAEEGVLRAEYFHGLTEPLRREAERVRLTLDQPVLKQLFADGVPMRIADPRTDPRTTKELITAFNIGPMILMPLVARDAVIGVLGVDRADGFGDVTDQDVALATAICDHAAVAARNARIYAETEARVRDMEALYDISNRLGSAQKQEDIFDYVLLQIRDLIPCRRVQLFLIDETGQLLLTTSRSALGQEGAPPDGHPPLLGDLRGCWALNQGQPFIVPDAERHFRCREDAAGDGVPARSYACIPVVAGSKPFGVLRITAAEPRGLTAEHLQLLNAIAGQVGAAVQRMRLMRQLEERTVRDPLTNVANHRHFLEKLRAELTRSLRSRSSVAVLYVDVDNFKACNDRLGHQVGDSVLRTVAQVLGECVRASDEVGRVGGDEFALFLPNTDLEGARVVAEKLRQRLGETRFPGDVREPVVRASVSIGLAAFPADGASAEEVMRAADEALYRAKAGGRDRVSAAGDP